MAEIGVNCRCVRCREYGHRARDGWKIGEPELKRLDYVASDGREVFLSFEDSEGTLFALLRMRFGDSVIGAGGAAIIRELHVFGAEVPLGERRDTAVQHRGLGRQLLREAEDIARREFGASRMAIISGVGAREYFRSEFGYELDGAYMVKDLGLSSGEHQKVRQTTNFAVKITSPFS
jgi:elongator complex protein 3